MAIWWLHTKTQSLAPYLTWLTGSTEEKHFQSPTLIYYVGSGHSKKAPGMDALSSNNYDYKGGTFTMKSYSPFKTEFSSFEVTSTSSVRWEFDDSCIPEAKSDESGDGWPWIANQNERIGNKEVKTPQERRTSELS